MFSAYLVRMEKPEIDLDNEKVLYGVLKIINLILAKTQQCLRFEALILLKYNCKWLNSLKNIMHVQAARKYC